MATILFLRARWQSIRFALQGLSPFFKREPNARVHFLATAALLIAMFFFNVSANEAILLIISAGFVWVAEMFNTAIEKIMDVVSKERNAETRFIKDISACAVLFASVIALITGAIIFIPKLFTYVVIH